MPPPQPNLKAHPLVKLSLVLTGHARKKRHISLIPLSISCCNVILQFSHQKIESISPGGRILALTIWLVLVKETLANVTEEEVKKVRLYQGFLSLLLTEAFSPPGG